MRAYSVAITGGIGSGKSTVAAILRKKGYEVLSCDDIAREVACEPAVLQQLSATFGDVVQGTPPQLDRERLAARVFHDGNALKQLNAIMHAAILARVEREIAAYRGELIFVEVPLLFETESEKRFDRVVVVMRDRARRIAATMQRSHLTREETEARIKNQFDYENLPKNEHTVIYNDSDLNDLERKVTVMLNEIKSQMD